MPHKVGAIKGLTGAQCPENAHDAVCIVATAVSLLPLQIASQNGRSAQNTVAAASRIESILGPISEVRHSQILALAPVGDYTNYFVSSLGLIFHFCWEPAMSNEKAQTGQTVQSATDQLRAANPRACAPGGSEPLSARKITCLFREWTLRLAAVFLGFRHHVGDFLLQSLLHDFHALVHDGHHRLHGLGHGSGHVSHHFWPVGEE